MSDIDGPAPATDRFAWAVCTVAAVLWVGWVLVGVICAALGLE